MFEFTWDSAYIPGRSYVAHYNPEDRSCTLLNKTQFTHNICLYFALIRAIIILNVEYAPTSLLVICNHNVALCRYYLVFSIYYTPPSPATELSTNEAL